MKKTHDTLRRFLPGVIISLLVTVLLIIFYQYNILERVELNLYDLRFKFRGQKEAESPIRIVAIDDASLGAFGKWPWRRNIHAKLIDILSEYGAYAVFFDVLFPEPDNLFPQDDKKLIDSARRAGNVYFPFYFPMATEKPQSLNPLFHSFGIPNEDPDTYFECYDVTLPFGGILGVVKGSGFVNGAPDEDGVYRRALLFIWYMHRIYPLISFKMACDYLGARLEDIEVIPEKYVIINFPGQTRKPIKIPVNDYIQITANYSGSIQSFRSHSYSDIIQAYEQLKRGDKPVIDLVDFKDKVVFIGMAATGSFDVGPTPFSNVDPIVGVHATVFDNILTGSFISHTTRSQNILLLIFLGIFMGFLLPRLTPVRSIIYTFMIFILYLVVNYYLFIKHGLSIIIVYPLMVIFLTDLFLVFYKYATEEKEKKWIKNVFSTYITPSVVTKILKDPSSLTLGGERREMTVYFSDLSGFTTISESLEPEDLVHLINEYLEAMTHIIFDYEGTLDKYEGDAIMAFWNAPVDQHDHALRCCKASLDCQKKLGQLQVKWKEEGRPPLSMRIGINTGPMIVGNMGSKTRMDYTVMGDSVNLGARLESANKEYGTCIMMSEFTKAQVENDIEFRELDALRVKGKKKPVHVYEVMAVKGSLSPDKEKVLALYSEGLKCYKTRKWDEGIRLFEEALKILPEDGPSVTYLSRCKKYKSEPPADDWNGVWELKTK
ncbi:MAG: CHASE2 domain-containing protein [Elusimicrobia bacterium]|nr:CHASE2 domain-containing protein [Elusimicrobiota bacterium]